MNPENNEQPVEQMSPEPVVQTTPVPKPTPEATSTTELKSLLFINNDIWVIGGIFFVSLLGAISEPFYFAWYVGVGIGILIFLRELFIAATRDLHRFKRALLMLLIFVIVGFGTCMLNLSGL